MFISSIREKVAALKKEGRPGTAETYASTLTSLAAYTKKKVLPFSAINPEFLREYEQWMVDRENQLLPWGYTCDLFAPFLMMPLLRVK